MHSVVTIADDALSVVCCLFVWFFLKSSITISCMLIVYTRVLASSPVSLSNFFKELSSVDFFLVATATVRSRFHSCPTNTYTVPYTHTHPITHAQTHTHIPTRTRMSSPCLLARLLARLLALLFHCFELQVFLEEIYTLLAASITITNTGGCARTLRFQVPRRRCKCARTHTHTYTNTHKHTTPARWCKWLK